MPDKKKKKTPWWFYLLLVGSIICLFSFSISESELICDDNLCVIKESSLFIHNINTRHIDLSQIKRFEVEKVVNSTSKSKSYHYYIVAITNDYEQFRFFKNCHTSPMSEKPQEICDELNAMLRDKRRNFTINY